MRMLGRMGLKMFKSLLNLTKDVVEVVTAPIEIAADLARVVTKPIADTAKDCVDAVKEEVEDLTE